MLWLTLQSLKRPSVTLLVAVALLVFGLSTVGSVKQEIFPSLAFPIVSVTTVYPGASAEVVDRDITQPIEGAISGVPGVEVVQSTSSEGFALTVLQFDFDADPARAMADVQESLTGLVLPTGVQPPDVGTFDFGSLPVVLASVSGDDLARVQARVEAEVIPALSAIPGVSQVTLTGGEDELILITLDPAKLAENKISQQQVTQILQANNLAFPVGSIDDDGRVMPLRVSHAYGSIDEIANIVLGLRGVGAAGVVPSTGTAVVPTPPADAPAATPVAIPDEFLLRLKDVATVERSTIPATSITRTNGQVSLGIEVSKDEAANTVHVTAAVEEVFDRVQADPADAALTFRIVQEQATAITESIVGVARGAILGAVAAVVIIFLFLLSFRSTLIAAVSIPLSIVVALLVMRLQDYSLNVITLGGLAVAVGRVVDDSIVVLENIFRHLRHGDDPNTSVVTGTREVAGAITASTLTTVAVFLPLGLAGGLISKLFLPFALTITYALLASLVVAVTIIPLLARLFLSRIPRVEERASWLQRAYAPMLAWSLNHRALTLLIAALLFAGSLGLGTTLRTSFLPDNPEKNISVTLATPPGTDLATAETIATEAEKIVDPYRADGRVSNVQTVIGSRQGGQLAVFQGGGDGGNQVRMSLVLADSAGDAERLADELEGQLDQVPGLASATVETIASEGGGGTTAGLDLVLVSKDIAALQQANDVVMARIGGEAGNDLGLTSVTSNLAAVKPAIQITVDPEQAMLHGTTTAQIAAQIRTLLAGDRAGAVTLTGDDRPLDVLVRVDRAAATLDQLRALPVGLVNPVPLSQVATIEEVPGATSITRTNGDRVATITGRFTRADTLNIQGAVEAEVARLGLPPGVEVRAGAQAASQAEALGDMSTALIIAVALVFVVMLFAFSSPLTPLVILLSIPLAAIGAILGLFLTGKPLGVTSLIGMLMLIGIVVTNAIVLLDLVEQYREDNMSIRDALLRAGSVRVRPILMTAIATIVALLPLATGIEEGGFLTGDLAIVVIGGLVTSTLLTLIVVPVVYSLVEGLRSRAGFGGPADRARARLRAVSGSH